MSWLRYVLKNLVRNRRRTVLTVASLAVSLFLVGVLAAAYRFLMEPAESNGTELVLLVSPRGSPDTDLPLWYQDRIAALPGVVAVSPFGYFAGRYGSHHALIPALGLEPHTVFRLFPDWKVSPPTKRRFFADRRAMIAGRALAQKYGWRVGQHIYLVSPLPLYSNLGLEFIIAGIYDSPNRTDTAVFHWSYLNAAFGNTDQAYQFWVRARSARDVPRLTRAIDAMFRDAPVPTRTGTLKQAMLDFLNLLGNVKLVLLGVMAAVTFSILLVVANTMSMAIRERTPEIATLRALGFRRRQILAALTAESVALAVLGAGMGELGAIAVARALSGYAVGGAVPTQLSVGGSVFALLLLLGVLIGLVSTLPTAWRAARLRIADALRYVG